VPASSVGLYNALCLLMGVIYPPPFDVPRFESLLFSVEGPVHALIDPCRLSSHFDVYLEAPGGVSLFLFLRALPLQVLVIALVARPSSWCPAALPSTASAYGDPTL